VKVVGVFLLTLATAGSAWWFYVETVKPLVATAAAFGWTAERCRMLSSVVSGSRVGRRGTIQHSASYSYTFPYGGREYQGHRYDFGASFSSGNYAGLARAVEAHPRGAMVGCYVNSSAPEAVLYRRPGRAVLLGAIPLYFLALSGGGALTFAAFRLRWAPARSGLLGLARRLDPPPAALDGSAARVGSGEFETRTLRLVGLNVLWNGFLAMNAVVLAAGAGSGPAPVLALAVLPLGAIGLRPLMGLLALVLNPRPVLTLEDRAPTPGALTRVHWRLPPARARLSKLVLTLEEVRAPHPGQRPEEERILSSSEIASVRGGEMASGSAPLQIPAHDAAGDERLLWRIRVHGEPRWWLEGPLSFVEIFPDRVAEYLRWPAVSLCYALPVKRGAM